MTGSADTTSAIRPRINRRLELLIIDLCIVGVVIFGLAIGVFLKWIAPLDPGLNASEVAAYFRDNRTGVLVAGVLFLNGGTLTIPFFALLMRYMHKMDGVPRVLGHSAFGLAIAQLWVFYLPALIWTTAAYRPSRNPDVTQALSDLGWFCFNIPVAVTEGLEIIVGVAMLLDRSPLPIFPRWMGWFSIFAGLSNNFNNMCGFFKVGPFAWNGAFGWYLAASMFFVWLVGMFVYMRRYAAGHNDAGSSGAASPDEPTWATPTPDGARR